MLVLGLATGFAAVCVQVVRLGLTPERTERITLVEPLARNWSRPDILDRHGRLLATDVEAQSLMADPRFVLDRDETTEQLARVLPDFDGGLLARHLAEPGRRFVWIRRGLTPQMAQRIHDLGLPGLSFRTELRRIYPLATIAPHLFGQVTIENRGLSGLEQHIEDRTGAQLVLGAVAQRLEPVRLSIDVAVQSAARAELAQARARFAAKAATALIMDVQTGEILAAVSLPDFDANRVNETIGDARLDRIQGGVFELGSILKITTLAMAYELGLVEPGKTYDAGTPLVLSGRAIEDFHGQKRPLTAEEVFIHSSNIGAARMALEAGPERQRAFLQRIGLLDRLVTQAGPVAGPLLPAQWDTVTTATISYGHGIALAPLQFASVVAGLVNGGMHVRPTLLVADGAGAQGNGLRRIVSEATSARIRALLRLNVTSPRGTGGRAAVAGIAIGGKTGTAEIARGGSYARKSVIASFIAVFPIDQPRYLTLVALHEPTGSDETRGEIVAGLNAAPTTARIIARVAPLLGLKAGVEGD